MPGLPRVPSASRIGLDEGGEVVGLFWGRRLPGIGAAPMPGRRTHGL